jgi:hypothetical protein
LATQAPREVWLFGSRAAGSDRADSEYDYFAFADENTLHELTAAESLRCNCIDLLVVFDGDRFRSPWSNRGREKGGSLKDWDWCASPDGTATYTAKTLAPGPDFSVDHVAARARQVFPHIISQCGVPLRPRKIASFHDRG